VCRELAQNLSLLLLLLLGILDSLHSLAEGMYIGLLCFVAVDLYWVVAVVAFLHKVCRILAS
jgi:hypothetical protein